MSAPSNLKSQLIRDEGLRLKPYTDSVGKLTIGYGHNLTDRGIPLDVAELLLDRDLADAETETLRLLPWVATLDEVRRGVLLNMAFNLGVHGLLGFRRMLAAAQMGDWPTVAAQMRDSLWAKQVGNRAERLAQQMETGAWQ